MRQTTSLPDDDECYDDSYEDDCDPWCTICNPGLEEDDLYENLDQNN